MFHVMVSVRKIIHVDMDAFFASVEQRDHPELRGVPVAVGSPRERGVVAAASYEARVFGVRSAMASVVARRKCPTLVFAPPRFDVYKQVSQQIRDIFAEFTALIEPLSLDEAYLDVTDHERPATEVAAAIRARIAETTGLTASAGVSYNKFLAKLASDQNKPNGQFVVRPGRGEAFVATLPVGRFHGVGPKTAARMNALGIFTGADLRQHPPEWLAAHFGKAGGWYHAIARGHDDRPVNPDRVRKSVGSETTFSADLDSFAPLLDKIAPLIADVTRICTARGITGRTVTVKVRYNDFTRITRSRSAMIPLDEAAVTTIAADLLRSIFPLVMPVRLIGVTLSNLDAPAPADQLLLV